MMVENGGPFGRFAGRELGRSRLADEVIIAAVDLARSLRAGRHRHRHRDVPIFVDEAAGERRLAGAGRRRQHEQQPAAFEARRNGGCARRADRPEAMATSRWSS